MLSTIHSYFSKQIFNRYDFINGILIGIGIVTNSLWPLLAMCVLLALTFIPTKD